MVGTDFIKFVGDLKVAEYVGVEDFADKMSFLYSVLVLMLCTTVIMAKQYLSTSIACYVATVPSGSDFDKFLENYCWVHGTIPFLPGETLPQTNEAWMEADREKRINYYQWVPFMLGLQTVFFYVPRLVWQLICYNRTGTDVENLISTSFKASKCSGEDRRGLVKHVAATLEMMLYQHRDYRHGKLADARRSAFNVCGMCVASKRLGTWLIFTYLMIKFIYLGNAVGQLYLMQSFLGFNQSLTNFGLQLAEYMVQGRDWQSTRIFPRISFCMLDGVRHLGSMNQYVGQCVLPVNMLNEKLYIFLWFWTCLVATLTALSIPLWVMRLGLMRNRTHFIKKFIRLRKAIDDDDRDDIRHFIEQFLRHDGVFLLRMISMNAGDVIAADIVQEMYDVHNVKYRQKNMLCDIPEDLMMDLYSQTDTMKKQRPPATSTTLPRKGTGRPGPRDSFQSGKLNGQGKADTQRGESKAPPSAPPTHV